MNPEKYDSSKPSSQFLTPKDNAFMIMENINHVRNWGKRIAAFITDEHASYNEYLGMIFRPDSMANDSLMELSTDYPFPVQEVYKSLDLVEKDLQEYVKIPSEEMKYNLANDIEYLYKRLSSFVQTVEKSIIQIGSDSTEIPFLLVILERLKIEFSAISKEIICRDGKCETELDIFLHGSRKEFADHVSQIYQAFLFQINIVLKTYQVSHSLIENQWVIIFEQSFPSNFDEFYQLVRSLGFYVSPQEYERQSITVTISFLGNFVQHLIETATRGILPENTQIEKNSMASVELPYQKIEKGDPKEGIAEKKNRDKQKNITDKSTKVSKPKLPRNPDVIDLIKELEKKSNKGKKQIQIAREFIKDTYENSEEKELKAQSLLRSARRYPHLW
jgi:hypothetical protein